MAAPPLQDGGSFMPHGMCFLWEPELVWLHVLSDVATALAYFAIPPALIYLVVRARREVPEGAAYMERRLPHEWMFLMFGVFIVACGTTHLLGAWNIWNADYWLSGGAKAVTALASVATAIALPPLVPRALSLVREARASEVRRVRLEEKNRELAELNERLRVMDAERARFFANISHELRTPLTLILGPVRERQATTEDPLLREDLDLIHRNARLLERRVRDLLDLAMEELEEDRLAWTDVELTAIVEDTVRRFRGLARRRDIAVEVDAPETFVVEADRDKLDRVVDNLVTNAFKFTPDGGTIRIRLAREDGEALVLEVGDSGPGIPPEERDQVFERYHQVPRARADTGGGSGLGLAIVRRFVHLHGGTVSATADDQLGGARFVVRLPVTGAPRTGPRPDRSGTAPFGDPEEPLQVAEPATVRTTRAHGAASEGPATVNESGVPRVLVVEDTPDMRRFLDRSLRPAHELRIAADGEEALQILEDWPPDLVITDLMMPGMDGEQLVARIRTVHRADEMPILVLSARADDEVRVRLLREGVQDYVTKPFAAEELRARVGNLVAMKRARDMLRAELAGAGGDIESLIRELGRRHRELEAALEEARRARDEAEAANQARTDFLAVMSHELRTPLNAIIGYTELLDAGVAGEVSAEQREHLGRIRVGAKHLVAVIDDILVFSREGSQPRPVEPAPVRVDLLVAEVIDEVRPDADQKGLEMVAEVPGELVIQTDRERLRRVATNLVANAVKFTARGSVRVRVDERPDAIEIRVADSGPGIAQEHRDRVFDPFWQVDQSSTRTAGGTGLGLSIVKRLTEQLGGSVRLESEPGEGSTFIVRLPREADRAEQGTRKTTT